MLVEYLTLIILTLICGLNADFLCQEHSWWNADLKTCVACTKCEAQEIEVRSCLPDRDTHCGSVRDLELDLLLLSKTDANLKERRNENLILLNKANSMSNDSEFDWQAALLIFALGSCITFFIVAAVVLMQHMKHWRHMEYRLNRDVEELSAKLMARLAEIQYVENGTFLIENPIKSKKSRRPVEVQCIYLDQFLANNKDINRNSVERGNFYIEETNCKE